MEELKVLNTAAPEVAQEVPAELSPLEQKKLQKQQEKEDAKRAAYAKAMISRSEAYDIAQKAAEFFSEMKAKEATNFLRDPLMANIAQTMALSDLLLKKGIITQDELQESLDEVYTKLYPQVEGEQADGEIEVGNEEGHAAQEAEEQPSEG